MGFDSRFRCRKALYAQFSARRAEPPRGIVTVNRSAAQHCKGMEERNEVEVKNERGVVCTTNGRASSGREAWEGCRGESEGHEERANDIGSADRNRSADWCLCGEKQLVVT